MRQKASYKNCTTIKLDNRRVTVVKGKDTFGINLRICYGSVKDRTIHNVLKNKVVETYFNISYESAAALYFCLKNELEKNATELKCVL